MNYFVVLLVLVVGLRRHPQEQHLHATALSEMEILSLGEQQECRPNANVYVYLVLYPNQALWLSTHIHASKASNSSWVITLTCMYALGSVTWSEWFICFFCLSLVLSSGLFQYSGIWFLVFQLVYMLFRVTGHVSSPPWIDILWTSHASIMKFVRSNGMLDWLMLRLTQMQHIVLRDISMLSLNKSLYNTLW